MKLKLKNVITFLLLIFIYSIPSLLFRPDNGYYNSLNKAFVSPLVFMIAWSIIFVLLAFINTNYLLNKDDYDQKEVKIYLCLSVINYIFLFLFPLTFFEIKSLGLSFVSTILAASSFILLGMQSLLLSKTKSIVYIPIILWSAFASVYSIILYLAN